MSGTYAIAEAAVGILAAVAHADGRLAEGEAGWWRAVRRRHALFAAVPHADMEDILRRVAGVLERQPWAEAVASWAALLPADVAAEVHKLALAALAADGEAAIAEEDIVGVLNRALGRD
jgi:hypothetical protein